MNHLSAWGDSGIFGRYTKSLEFLRGGRSVNTICQVCSVVTISPWFPYPIQLTPYLLYCTYSAYRKLVYLNGKREMLHTFHFQSRRVSICTHSIFADHSFQAHTPWCPEEGEDNECRSALQYQLIIRSDLGMVIFYNKDTNDGESRPQCRSWCVIFNYYVIDFISNYPCPYQLGLSRHRVHQLRFTWFHTTGNASHESGVKCWVMHSSVDFEYAVHLSLDRK